MTISTEPCPNNQQEIRFPSSAMTAVIASMSLLFISPTMTWGYTNTFQSTLPSLSNQTLASTLIDGTGALPKPNTTIVIDGNRIVFVSNNTADTFDRNFSAFSLTSGGSKNSNVPNILNPHKGQPQKIISK
jgi:hypothetical protein